MINERSMPTAVNPAHSIQAVGWGVSHQMLIPARLTPKIAMPNNSHRCERWDEASILVAEVSGNLCAASGIANKVLMNGALAKTLNPRTCQNVIMILLAFLVY